MKKSFVFKDGTGKPSGYLMQAGADIRCRLRCGGAIQVTLLFSDGSSERRSAQDCSREMVWGCTGKTLTGAFAAQEGQMAAFTDETAAKAFRMERTAKKKEANHQQEEPVRQTRPAIEEAQAPGKKRAEAHAFPERRWPPPCCMAARYSGGAWREI